MKSTGVSRAIDELGRIVIPKEIRTTLDLAEGTKMEFFVEGTTIYLKKQVAVCSLCGKEGVVSIGDKKLCRSCIEQIKALED